MKEIKVSNLKVRDIEPFEHLEDIIKNTTPYQRYQWLEQAWEFWRLIRKTYPKRIIALQDKFRAGKI